MQYRITRSTLRDIISEKMGDMYEARGDFEQYEDEDLAIRLTTDANIAIAELEAMSHSLEITEQLGSYAYGDNGKYHVFLDQADLNTFAKCKVVREAPD